MLTSTITILGALIVMACIRWELALVVAILVPVFLVVIMSMRKSLGSGRIRMHNFHEEA